VRRAPLVLLVVAVLALVACSDDDTGTTPPCEATDASSDTTASSSSTTTVVVPADGSCPNQVRGSSPAEFDAAEGTYAVQAVAYDAATGDVTFNVVQWLSGEDAVEAWQQANPDDPEGPPNDYLIVDENDRLRTAPLDAQAAVLLTHLATDSTPSVEPEPIDGLAAYLDGQPAGTTYWVTFADDEITTLCEAYRP
jgi:hypothetical protein